MASSDNSDAGLSCSVCKEHYEEEGEKRPVLLPCTHTLCFACLSRLKVESGKLQCPECRRRIPVGSGVQGFPTNRYMLQNLAQKKQFLAQE